jgi:ABC-2 type transport system ATP-binding protein
MPNAEQRVAASRWFNLDVTNWEQTPSGYTLTVSDPDLAAPALARALVGAGADILSIAESRHSLQDV